MRWLGGLLLVALWGGTARAQSTTPSARSIYEEDSVAAALAATHDVPELEPEGKTLEAVDVVPLDVIEARDPAPMLLNMFHITTRAGVIRREVLLRIGEPYRQYLVDDSVRALRQFRQISLVVAIPTKGRTPDSVRLLVVTKDVWSLRAQLEFGVGANGLDVLKLEPTERNVGGTFDSVFGRFELYPESITLGGGAYIPRLDARPLYFSTDANVIINRMRGEPEGTFGQAIIRAPQLSARQRVFWSVIASWRSEVKRRYVGAKVAEFDAPSTSEVEHAPDQYRARSFTETLQGTRSFGLARKVDLTAGAEANVRQFVGFDPAVFGPAVAAEHQRLRVPTSDTRAAPFFETRLYETRYFRTHDLATLGLGEDYRLGYDLTVRAYPVLKAFGSSRDFAGVSTLAQYTLKIADGFGRATAESVVELRSSAVPTTVYAGNVALYSPRFFLGRLVVDGLLLARPRNYLNTRSTVGGESRLRGQPSAALIGENLIAYNAELRSRPLTVLASQLGGVLFYDVADAFDAWPPKPKSSVGVGVRLVLPQLDRNVIRFDVGVPIVRAPGAGPIGFYLALEQAFSSRTSDLGTSLILPAGAGALGQ